MKNYIKIFMFMYKMKYSFFYVLLFFLFNANLVLENPCQAQGTAINITGAPPDSSAILDVDVNNQGVLIPRLTSAQRDAIPSPATGLIIYNTDTKNFNFKDNNEWVRFYPSFVTQTTGTTSVNGGVSINLTNTAPANSVILDINDDVNYSRGVLFPRTTTSQIMTPAAEGLIIYNINTNGFSYYDGAQWLDLCDTLVPLSIVSPGTQNIKGVAINTTGAAADASAMLDISSINQGFLTPRITTTERNNIQPADGLIIYNKTTKVFEYFTGLVWNRLEYIVPFILLQPANTTICAGNSATFNLSVTTLTGISYQWQYFNGVSWINVTDGIPPGAIYVGATNDTIIISGISVPGSYTYQCAMSNICSQNTSSNTVTLIIDTVPNITITGDTTICIGDNTTLTASGGSSYIWNTGSNNSSITVSPVATTTYTVTVTSMGNTCTNSLDVTVSVYPVPDAVTAITGPDTVCQGDTVSYSVPIISGATSYSWVYTGIGTVTNNLNPTSIIFPNNATSGILTVYGYNQGCKGDVSAGFSITVDSLPVAGNINGPDTVCRGNINVPYSIPAIANATSYTWTYSGSGAIINGNTNQITMNFSSTATSGYLAVTPANHCGNGTTSNYLITVDSVPFMDGHISGTDTVCQGWTGILYSVPPIVNATTYTWIYSGTGAAINGNSNQISIDFSATATSGDLTVIAGNMCGAGSVSAIFPIIVNTDPAIVVQPKDTSVCIGNNSLFTVIATGGGLNYQWQYFNSSNWINVTNNDPPGFSYTGANSSSLAISGITTSGIFLYKCFIKNICDSIYSDTAILTVTSKPIVSIAGTSIICIGQSTTLTATGGGTYLWDDNSTNASITVSPTTTTTYHVTVSNGPICSATDSITVNVIPLPSVPAAGNNGPVCEGSTLTLSASNITGASYSWSGSNGFTSAQQNPTVSTNTALVMAGTYTVTATVNGCSNSSASTNVIVIATPLAAGNISGVSPVCQGDNNIPYSTAPITNATSYSWVYSGAGVTINGSTNNVISLSFSVSATSGNLTVAGINNSNNVNCTGPYASLYPITVNPIPFATATHNAPVCEGAGHPLILTASPSGMTSYSWKGPSSYCISTPNYTVTVTTSPTTAMAGTYYVTVTNTFGCKDTAVTPPVGICSGAPSCP